MSQQSPKKEESEQPSENSPVPTDKEIKKQRKKKQRALKEFLAKPENEIAEVDVPRKAEEEPEPEQNQSNVNCKICGQLSQRRKQCEFCKDTICSQHIRKKRKYKNTNKFARICDDCEDRYLFDKYLKTESKAEEALAMQEMILEAKRNQFADLAGAKHTRIQMLRNKHQELEEEKKDYETRNKASENDYNNKWKKMEMRISENLVTAEQLVRLEESLPRPLNDDYSLLEEQNNKITKELVKFEKLCAEALKAKSTREKQLYEAYYNWEKKQANKAALKKNEDCLIY